jgi:hypothetical protein
VAFAHLGDPPANWKPDIASLERAEKILEELVHGDPHIRRLVVTLEGIIFDGGPEPRGVTKDPWHPADIMISSWKDIQKP